MLDAFQVVIIGLEREPLSNGLGYNFELHYFTAVIDIG